MVAKRKPAVILLLALILVGAATVGGWLLWASEDEARPGTTWSYYEVQSNGLTVHSTMSPCDEVEEADVHETDDRVVVTLHVDHGEGFCAQLAVPAEARVDLERPLGRRPVFDGACLADDNTERQCLRASRRP